MIDISAIEQYIIELSPFNIKTIKSDIDSFGREKVFSNHIKYLDCSRVTETGMRLQQTIGFPYMSEITQILYIIQTYFEDDIDNRLQQVLDLHKRNLEFEIENPPIWYDGEKGKKKFEKQYGKRNKSIRSKQTKMKFDENGEPIKSVAERKLAIKVGKINSLKFNLKPVGNGDNNPL